MGIEPPGYHPPDRPRQRHGVTTTELADIFTENPTEPSCSRYMKTLAEILDERASKAAQGNWVPASGGTEVPFTTRTRRRLLYCWQPSTGRHAYLDCDQDIFLTDEEAWAALATH